MNDLSRRFPRGWRHLRLKNLVGSLTAGAWGEEPDEERGVRCIRAADFDREHLRVSLTKAPLRKIPPEVFRSCSLSPGDLILEKSGGGDQQPVGAVVMFDHNVPAVPTNFAVRVRPAPTVDPRFLSYVFASAYFLRLNVRAIKQTTGLQNLDVGSFLAEEWAVPPPVEQVRIADFLDRETARIDAVLARKRRLMALLSSRWESQVFAAITRGLDADVEMAPTSLGWAGNIPAHWTVRPVYADFDVQLGKMLNAERAAGPDPAPYLRNTNVQWDHVDVQDLATMSFDEADKVRYRLRHGDLLVCEGGEAGRAAIWRDELAECYYQKAVHRVRPRGDKSTTGFLMYCLWAAASMNVFNVEGNQSTIVHLTAEKLRAHRFPMPPRHELDAVVAHLDRLREDFRVLTERYESQMDLLQEHRQALITVAVTGELDPVGEAA